MNVLFVIISVMVFVLASYFFWVIKRPSHTTTEKRIKNLQKRGNWINNRMNDIADNTSDHGHHVLLRLIPEYRKLDNEMEEVMSELHRLQGRQ